MARRLSQGEFFNVDYGIASAKGTVGNLTVSTTQAAYHGMSIVSLTTVATITVYDSINTATGNILDIFTVSGTSTNRDRNIPIMARNGIYVVASGTGVQHTVFFGPKG